MQNPHVPTSRPLGRELTFALVLLFAGTGLLGALSLFVPGLVGYLQALLAVLLFGIPYLVLRGTGTTIDDLGVELSPWRRTLGWALLVMLIIFPPFVVGHHYWQIYVYGSSPEWDASALLRWGDEIEDPPRNPCRIESEDGALRAWIVNRGLWITGPKAPAALEVTPRLDGRAPRGAREVSCTDDGAPRAGRAVAAGPDGTIALSPGHGLWLPLGRARRLRVALEVDGEPAPLRLGAFGHEPGEPGVLEASRSWTWLLTFVLVHLGLVALPEEWFFRGYLQTRLDQRYGTLWTLWGARLGPGILLSALAFALLHPILVPGLHRLAVFFPALLFGWLRARTGNIGAAVVVHAGSNLLQAIISRMYV